MARSVDKLNARTVATVGEPGRYSDGAGLYLIVDPGGARRWLFLYRAGSKQREMGLGSAGAVSLADARRKRDEARKLLAEGRDPIDEKRRATSKPAGIVTFGVFADELVSELRKGFRNEKHADQWAMTLKVYAAPLRPKPIDSISTDDVLAVLQPIWTTKSETASRTRGRIERILDAARAKGLRQGENPARWRGHLDQLLAKRRKLGARGHHKALPYPAVPSFVAELRARSAVAARALEFLILAAARTGEVIAARWDEIDRDAKVWTIPAERMKREREHRVPLVDRAVVILDEMAGIRRGDFVFPSFRADRHLSNGAFDALLERMKVDATAHGFRSSFRDWAGDETHAARETIEAALAHAVGDETERAYRRSDALAKRRELMVAWAAFLETP